MNVVDVFDLGLLRLQELFIKNFTISELSRQTGESNGRVEGVLNLDGTKHTYLVLTHRGLAPLRSLNVQWQKQKKAVPIYFVPFLEAKERAACRKEGIQFVDTMGNCYLDFPGCHVYVDKEVNAPKRLIPTGKSLQSAGLRFILAVYNEPALLNQKYADIAEKTGLSTGSLSGIFEDLRANEFVTKDEETGLFAFTNELELVKRFAYAYLADVRPKIRRGTFYLAAPDTLDRIKNAAEKEEILLGGQHAASLRGNYLSSPAFNLYTDIRIGTLAKAYRLIPVGGSIDPIRDTVEVYSLFGGQFAAGQSTDLSLVNDLLIYADLLDSHDVRVHDAAQKLLTNEIFNKFHENWLRYGSTPGVLSAS